MTVTGAPDLAALKAWLGLADHDTVDDVVLQRSLDAALEAQCRVVCYPRDGFGDAVYTADLVTAIFIRAQRLTARRNSPEGVVGISGTDGDFVGARLPGTDSDVIRLESPHRIQVVS